MHTLPILKPGDHVEIITPASRCSAEVIHNLHSLLTSWGLECHVRDDLFGDDLLCANSDKNRLDSLRNALHNPVIKAIICARGGYGSMRLIPGLETISPPAEPKLLVGMSDITALHLFFETKWNWPSLHGALARDKFSDQSIFMLKQLLFAEVPHIELLGTPLNALAEEKKVIKAAITGGNLSLVQASIGTSWQLTGKNKIVLLEEIGERGYRVDRMFEHLMQSHLLKDAVAIFLGDFIAGQEPNGSSLISPVLERFAERCDVPVFRVSNVGHGYINFPVPLGCRAELYLGETVRLVCFR